MISGASNGPFVIGPRAKPPVNGPGACAKYDTWTNLARVLARENAAPAFTRRGARIASTGEPLADWDGFLNGRRKR